jgi:gliding motility-associated-like protein
MNKVFLLEPMKLLSDRSLFSFSLFWLSAVFVVTSFQGNAQIDCDVPGNYCMSATTLNICDGVLFDAGGGAAYPDDQIVMTICPDVPGNVIQLEFNAFALQTSPNNNNSDFLYIFDGPTTGAPSMGNYTGSSLQGLAVTATVNNTSGCLTLVFDPNGNPNAGSPGFEAQITCTTPCAPPISASAFADPLPSPGEDVLEVCVGAPISFADNGSFAQPGFTLEQFNWNFGNGVIDSTSGPNVTYTFDEPGEYLVSLTVEDNNGCGSLNLEPLAVLVSTIPQFPGVASNDTDFCFGQEITLDAGTVISPTWTDLPPQVVAGETYLADGAGFSFSSSLVFDFFEENAVLEDCADLFGVLVNMEHSFMGDLGISIMCPNGTAVDLVEWGTNGGGGTFLGEAIDDGGTDPGVGYDYTWDPDATNGTWGQNAAGNTILPSGSYEAAGNMCDLVGCPLNGAWTFTVTDNLAIDNGYIFYWGINFNPILFPGITTFTPTIGMGADSSYWSGPFIGTADQNLDVITLELTEPGDYNYTYTVVNSFGCSNDTTITVVVEIPPLVDAGDDLIFSCEPLEIEGGFQDLPTPLCGDDAGSYTHCYADGQNYQVTYCPDNPGDGFSAIEITFQQGTVENFFDEFYVYDGDNTSAPLLAGYAWPLYGNLAGLTFTATNPSGCLTILMTPDGSVSCQSGSQTEWIYEVGCASPVDYIWSWSPSAGLSDSDSPVTTLNTLATTTTFTLTGYPVGTPECAVTDDVVIEVVADMNIQVENLYQVCPGNEVTVEAPEITGGTAPYDIEWRDAEGNLIPGDGFTIPVTEAEVFCVTVSDECGVEQEECVLVNLFPEIPATFVMTPPFGCDPLNVQMTSDYTDYNQVASMEWDLGNGAVATTMGSVNAQYTQEGLYYPSLTITDLNGCVFSDTTENPVNVWPTPFAVFNTDPDIAILPNTTFQFNNLSVGGTDYVWNFSGLGTSTAIDTTFTFPAETAGIYYVWLHAYSNYGCVDSTYRQIIVEEDIDIYIPNTFTPDYDGINDAWMVQGKGFQDQGFLMQVFNKWGEVVFESTDPGQAWTGSFQGGEHFVPDGVYLYRCTIRDIQNDVNYLYEGHVLVLR